jgi:hypothetical protein
MKQAVGWFLLATPAFVAVGCMVGSVGWLRSAMVLLSTLLLVGILVFGAWLSCAPDDQ